MNNADQLLGGACHMDSCDSTDISMTTTAQTHQGEQGSNKNSSLLFGKHGKSSRHVNAGMLPYKVQTVQIQFTENLTSNSGQASAYCQMQQLQHLQGPDCCHVTLR
jgi:hypothetical protein